MEIISSKQIIQARNKLKSCWSDESKLTQKAIIGILQQIERQTELLEKLNLKQKKTKRKPSEWSLFVGKYLREGKTIQEASKDWKKRDL